MDMRDTTRRQVMTTATLGIAAAATVAAPAVAQDVAGAAAGASAKGGKQNPRDKYAKPPYKSQSQPWPGLASRMDPRPDHGETSYVGSGRLAGRKAAAIPGDIRTAGFCLQLVERAVAAMGGLDLLVCNAARQQSIPSILDVTDEEFDRTMKTNIYAPFWIIRAALPHLEPGSAIIGTTSEQAYNPDPDLYVYAQTKAATMNYVKSLAKQLGPKGIRVNGVAPGPIWTPLQVSGGASQGKLVTFGATTPLGRAGQPAELAGIFVRLAEDDGSYTTGNIYGAGGGQGQP